MYPIFLSVVLTVRNQETQLAALLNNTTDKIAGFVSDYELIVVDNASEDGSVGELKRLTSLDGLPNLQVYALVKEVNSDTAAWVGVENALGDYVAVLDPQADDLGFLPEMIEQAVRGSDVTFARNTAHKQDGSLYRCAGGVFNWLYRYFNGVDLAKEAPGFRLLSKRVVNFILQHPTPAVSYRHLPATGGFARSNIEYRSEPTIPRKAKRLGESIDHGMRLLISTTPAPARLVTGLSFFGAVANLVYSIYVLGVAVLKNDVAPGWVSLSLQQSGMFFLISLVLLVLGEYILHMANVSSEGPMYHVSQEFTSAKMTRRDRLNIEINDTETRQKIDLMRSET